MNNHQLKNVDRIFVLSLKTSIKRQNIFKEYFPELINLDIFEWFLVDRDSENTERGCYTSHQKIIDLAKKEKYKTILVIEDDVKPLVSWNEFVKRFNEIKRPKDWVAIQLGYIPIKTTKTNDTNLYAINCNYFTEAFLINVANIEIPEYSGSQIDCYLFCNGHSHLDLILNPNLTSRISKGMYAYSPRLFQQIFEDSDIGHDNKIIVFFYKFYGSVYDITELSSYINLLLLSFLIVFALLLLGITIVLSISKYGEFKKYTLSLFILIILIITIICYSNGNEIIELELEH